MLLPVLAAPSRAAIVLAGLALCAAGCSPGATTDNPGAASGRPTATPPPTAGGAAGGRVLHASPQGYDGGAGTADDPFGTLEGALDQLVAGDTLVLDGGTYEETVDLVVSPGTRDAPVRVVAAPGERPILRGLLWLEDPSWWRIEGLDVTWDDDNDDDDHMVKITGGTDWVMSEAEIWGARSFAAVLVAGDPERFVLRQLYVHDTVKSNGPNEDHLIYLNPGTGGGVVEGCLLARSPNGRAIKVGPADEDGDPVGQLVLRYNTMVDNLGPSNVQLAWDTRSVEIYRNIMVGAADGRHNVTTFDLRGEDNVVRDNIGARSAGVLEPDVDGLVDGGGNQELDPLLDEGDGTSFAPTVPAAGGHGHTALSDAPDD